MTDLKIIGVADDIRTRNLPSTRQSGYEPGELFYKTIGRFTYVTHAICKLLVYCTQRKYAAQYHKKKNNSKVVKFSLHISCLLSANYMRFLSVCVCCPRPPVM